MAYGYIYQIKNLENGKVYIGQSIDFEKRKNQHLQRLKVGKHHNKELQKDFDAYIDNGFNFKVIESAETKEELDQLEASYINKTKTFENGYNIRDGLIGGKDQLNVDLPKDLMERFRELSGSKFQWKRGYLRKGIEEALLLWIEEEEK